MTVSAPSSLQNMLESETKSSHHHRGDDQTPTTKEVDCPGFLHRAIDGQVSNRSKERTHHHRKPLLSASDKASILGKELKNDPDLMATQADTTTDTADKDTPSSLNQQRHKSARKSDTKASSSAEERSKTRIRTSPSSRTNRSSRPKTTSRSPSRRKHRIREHTSEKEVTKKWTTTEVSNKTTTKVVSSSNGVTARDSVEPRKSPSQRKNRKEVDQRHDTKKNAKSTKLTPILESTTSRQRSGAKRSDPIDKSPSRRKKSTRTRTSSRLVQTDQREDLHKVDASKTMASTLEIAKESSFDEIKTNIALLSDKAERGLLPMETTLLGALSNELKEKETKQMPLTTLGLEQIISTKQSPNKTSTNKPERTVKDRQNYSQRSQLALGNSENGIIGESLALQPFKIHHEKENGYPDQRHKASQSSHQLPLSEHNASSSLECARRSNPLEKYINDNNAKAYGGFTAELKDSERSASRLSSTRSLMPRSKTGCDIAAATASSSRRGQLQRSKSLILRRQLSDKRICEGSTIRKDVDRDESMLRHPDQLLLPIAEKESEATESSIILCHKERPKGRQVKVRRRKSLLHLGKVQDSEPDRNEKVRVKDTAPKSPSTRPRKLESRIRRTTSRVRASDDVSITPKLREETVKFALIW